jgi:hypothetical protein
MGESPAQQQTGFGYARPMLNSHMLNHELLDDWLPQLQHPAVRDLAWTLLAAPLLAKAGCRQRHPLTASAWMHQPDQLADWLMQQDMHPAALQDWLTQSRSQRLGIHYERLWQFALQQAPGVELLAANLPVRQAGQTLGELDLLLRDSDGDHHLELAIKLYLGPPAGDGRLPLNWRGAGRADNLARKLEHLCCQQLPLSGSPAAQPILAEHGVTRVQASLWLGGYLFYPWPDGCATPAGCHPEHVRGHWLQHREWPAFVRTSTARHWRPVPRDCRLAPVRFDAALCWTDDQLTDWQRALANDAAPSLLAGFTQQADGSWKESARVMLLNDGWPAGPKP